MTQWNPATTFVWLRKDGPGHHWQPLDRSTTVTGASGGGQAVESNFVRGKRGGFAYIGKRVTGNPERFTGQINTRVNTQNFLTELQQMRCDYDLAILQNCDDPYNFLSYKMAFGYLDAWLTSRGYTTNQANGTEDNAEDIMNQYDFSAGVEQRYKKLRLDDIKGMVSDVDFAAVQWVGTLACADCASVTENEYIAVTVQDNTPGYIGNPAPVFYYTTDGGTTWNDGLYIEDFPNGDASDVILAGGRVLVACPTIGVAYADYQSIKDGAINPNVWSLATGFSAPNGPNKLLAVNGLVILAVGDGGRIWRSTDGGFSFSALTSPTAEDLTSIAGTSDAMAWAAGDNGTLLRISGSLGDPDAPLSISPVTVQDAGGNILSANINVVKVADGRGDWPYLGTANGQIWHSENGGEARPIFVNAAFVNSGNGQITDLDFAGLFGDVLFISQTNSNNNSRILRDRSGGALGKDVEIVSEDTSPVNNGIARIAAKDPNTGLVVGAVVNSYGFIGSLTGI